MSLGMNFVMLRFDGIYLAFPSDDVLGVESFSSIRQDEIQVPAMGTLEWEDEELPVYGLSREFNLLQDIHQRRFCVCLAAADPSERYAMVCETVEQYVMPDDTLIQELPKFMQILDTPVRSLFRLEDNLVLLCTAESLGAFIAMSEKQYE